MIPLRYEFDYITCDRAEWLADRTDESASAEAQAAYDEWRENGGGKDEPRHESEAVLAWLKELGATGIYGDGGPVQVCTYNEDNFLDDDMIVTFGHTEKFDTLFIWQHGIFTDSKVNVLIFNGDDDADAFNWSNGYAGHADGTVCDSEWIIESAVKLWRNGGKGDTPMIGDLEKDDDDRPLCPDHKTPLAFTAA